MGEASEAASHSQLKEEEQAVIQRQIEATEAQLDRLEEVQAGPGNIQGMTMAELEVRNRPEPHSGRCSSLMGENQTVHTNVVFYIVLHPSSI